MATPSKSKIINYFTKLPSKTCIVEQENPRKSAPVFNKQHVEEFQNRVEQFDAELLLPNDVSDNDYISSIKSGEQKPFKVDKKPKGSLRARLLQFQEDVRPPYFGTWQKSSKLVTGRRPFGQDNEIFDYEVDSEAEWDLGGPGESLKGDDSEEEADELDDYEIDMKTFVPHGYVSDDEVAANSDNELENPSANQSIDEDLDAENDSNSTVKIIYDSKAVKLQTEQQTPQQQQPQVQKQTPKMEIKPITLGLNFEDCLTISEAKLQFLRAFQGVSCGPTNGQ